LQSLKKTSGCDLPTTCSIIQQAEILSRPQYHPCSPVFLADIKRLKRSGLVQPDKYSVSTVGFGCPVILPAQDKMIELFFKLLQPSGCQVCVLSDLLNGCLCANRPAALLQKDNIASAYLPERLPPGPRESRLHRFLTREDQVQVGLFQNGKMEVWHLGDNKKFPDK